MFSSQKQSIAFCASCARAEAVPHARTRSLGRPLETTINITHGLLDDLGYRSALADGREDETGIIVTGMTLFNVLKRWELHCCKSLFLNDFAEHYTRTRVEKVGDVDHLIARLSRAPAAR
jgi:hypothetical protein